MTSTYSHAAVRIAGLLLFAMSGLVSTGAQAQEYPSRPVKLMVGFAPGGATDQLGRLYAKRLSEKLGQPFVVENRMGAGGNLAIQVLAQSPGDGYTLAMGANYIGVNAALKRNPYDWERDLTPIAQTMATPNLLVVPAASKIRTIQDLVREAKAAKSPLTFGSAGMGTSIHLAAELFKVTAGVNLTHIPYKGVSPAEVDLVGGVVDMMFGSISTALPLVKGNRLHAIALTGLARVKDLPNVPTLDELGMKGFEVEASYMLVAPAKLAPDVLKRLASAVAEINHEPETAAFAERIYARVLSGGPEESRAFLRREMEKWQGVASATGLKID